MGDERPTRVDVRLIAAANSEHSVFASALLTVLIAPAMSSVATPVMR